MSGVPSRGAKRLLIITATALVALFALVSSAAAEPKGIFKKYNDCPTATPGLALCTFGQTTGGEFSIGATKVPINQTITLQGGAIPTGGENPNEYFLLPAKDGNSLSKTALNVPGGLLNLVNCEEIKGSGFFEIIERATCKAIFENKTTGVTATTELVATATNPAILNLAALVEEAGPTITLPVRVHLKNPLLGEGCYIGSEAHPVQLHLTDGTTSPPLPNKPIKGKLGTPESEIEKGYESVKITENSLVDNAFSAPSFRRLWRVLLVPDRADHQRENRSALRGRPQHGDPRRLAEHGRSRSRSGQRKILGLLARA